MSFCGPIEDCTAVFFLDESKISGIVSNQNMF
jgi:hypothetical protein